MNQLELPPEFDLPAGHAERRRDVFVAEIDETAPTRPAWRRPATIVAVAAAVVVGIVAVPLTRGGDKGRVLAYALEVGDQYAYEFEYHQTRDQFRMDDTGDLVPRGLLDSEASGRLTYSVDEGRTPDTFLVELVATGSERTAEDDVAFPDETNDPANWPTISAAVDTTGRTLDMTVVDEDPNVGIPSFLLPDPVLVSRSTTLPFAFGPPFPDTPLDIGDSWTTEIPPLGCDPVEESPCGPGTADHAVVREEAMLGRPTLVIESTYSVYPSPGTWALTTTGVSTNTVTAWFDPDAGILVRIEQHATLDLVRETGDDIGTVMHDERDYSFIAELVDN